jgi:hypothetical protein
MVPWLGDAWDACLHVVKRFTCTRAQAANARAAEPLAALILCIKPLSISFKKENTREQKDEEACSVASRDFRDRWIG